jgi:hypothetical protein
VTTGRICSKAEDKPTLSVLAVERVDVRVAEGVGHDLRRKSKEKKVDTMTTRE